MTMASRAVSLQWAFDNLPSKIPTLRPRGTAILGPTLCLHNMFGNRYHKSISDQRVYGLIYISSALIATPLDLLCMTLSYSPGILDSEQNILDLGNKTKLNCLLCLITGRYQNYYYETVEISVLGHYQTDSMTSYNILLHPNQPFGIC